MFTSRERDGRHATAATSKSTWESHCHMPTRKNSFPPVDTALTPQRRAHRRTAFGALLVCCWPEESQSARRGGSRESSRESSRPPAKNGRAGNGSLFGRHDEGSNATDARAFSGLRRWHRAWQPRCCRGAHSRDRARCTLADDQRRRVESQRLDFKGGHGAGHSALVRRQRPAGRRALNPRQRPPTLRLFRDDQGAFSQTYGRIIAVILHINDVPCCWTRCPAARR